MHEYDYRKLYPKLLTADNVAAICTIHEFKGQHLRDLRDHATDLTSVARIARIQSTGASNRLEGISTTDKRLEDLVNAKTIPHNRNEKEISGYRKVLELIHEDHEFIELKYGNILQLHRDLYAYLEGQGGRLKQCDNKIVERDGTGHESIRFVPVPAFQTADHLRQCIEAFGRAVQGGKTDPLLLIPAFILDFLCIHPFDDGNGRMSRLLTLLLLYKAGYDVGKFVSLEMIIEESKETYYESLQLSSKGWHDNNSNYLPFTEYLLGVIIHAYKLLAERLRLMYDSGFSKSERIKAFLDGKLERFTKKELHYWAPDISMITLERTLNSLLNEGFIIKIGNGRSCAYIRNMR